MILIGNNSRMVPHYTDNNINQSNVIYDYFYTNKIQLNIFLFVNGKKKNF